MLRSWEPLTHLGLEPLWELGSEAVKLQAHFGVHPDAHVVVHHLRLQRCTVLLGLNSCEKSVQAIALQLRQIQCCAGVSGLPH